MQAIKYSKNSPHALAVPHALAQLALSLREDREDMPAEQQQKVSHKESMEKKLRDYNNLPLQKRVVMYFPHNIMRELTHEELILPREGLWESRNPDEQLH